MVSRFLCVVLVMFGLCLQAQDSLLVSKINSRSTVFLQQIQSSGNNAFTKRTASSNSNVAVIQQIGSNNIAFTNTVSGVSTINYLQIRDDNTIESYSGIDNVSEQIIQQGNSNNVLNYSFGPVNNATLNLYQTGNNLSFEKFGTNTQTNNLSFRFSGDNRTVIVRSY